MKCIVHESMIFPPAIVYSHYVKVEEVKIEVCEHYQKRSFRNRYFLSGPNGILSMSIPLEKGKNYRTPIKEVKISYAENWVGQHINTIKSCYGSSPYFIHYSDEIFALLERRFSYLLDLNENARELISKITGIRIATGQTEQYQEQPQCQDLRDRYGIKSKISSGITYSQVFEEKFGFIDGLSILDLVFCTGPESKILLTRMIHEDDRST